MNQFDASRVKVEYRDRTNAVCPVLGRKYTVTHSDDTAELFITIGRCYAEDKVGNFRDEVRLAFEEAEGQLRLSGTVLISERGRRFDAAKRNEIFLREMPLALQAVRYADRHLYECCMGLDEIPICIHFQSDISEYNRMYDFGKMKFYNVYGKTSERYCRT